MKRILRILLSISIVFPASPVRAEAPPLINFQGRLVDPGGAPVNDPQTVVVSIYAEPAGGTPLWSQTLTNVPVVNGVFSLQFGGSGLIDAAGFGSGDRYLGVKVGPDPELQPREKLSSVPTSIYAEKAGRLASSDGIVSIPDTVSVGGDLLVGAGKRMRVSAIADSTNGYWLLRGYTREKMSYGDRYVTDHVFESGDVGIGTTEPQARLEVSGDARVSGRFEAGGSAKIRLDFNSATPTVLDLANLDTTPGALQGISVESYLARTGDATPRLASLVVTGKEKEWTSDSGTNDSFLSFWTTRDGSYAEKMRVTSAGNVGIGTTAPQARLDVAGTINATAFVGSGAGLTGVTASDPTKVAKAGDTMTGELTLRTASAGHILTVENTAAWGANVRMKSDSREWVVQGLGSGDGQQEGHFRIVDVNAVAPRLSIDKDGNVGLGVTNPAAKLDVAGGLRLSGSFPVSFDPSSDSNVAQLGPNFRVDRWGNVGASLGDFYIRNLVFNPSQPGVGLSSDGSNVGLNIDRDDSNAGDFFAVGHNGIWGGAGYSNWLMIDDAGNVGLGTTQPAERLELSGNLLLRSPLGRSIRLWDDASGAAAHLQVDNSLRISGAETLHAYGFNRIQLNTSGGGRLDMDEAGNVGLGVTSPAEKLEVAGTVKATGFVGSGAGLTGVTASDPTKVSKSGDTLTGPLYLDNTVELRFRNSQGTDHAGAIHAGPDDSLLIRQRLPASYMRFDTGTTERMRITSVGRVGVGTTGPGAALHIHQSETNLGLRLTGNGTANYLDIFQEQGGGQWGYVRQMQGNVVVDAMNGEVNLRSGSGQAIRFRPGGASYENAPVVLSPSGAVGIGTTAPGTKLDIWGGGSEVVARLMSRAADKYAALRLGRTTDEGALAVIGANGYWSSLATGGDVVLRSDFADVILTARNASGAIRFGTGTPDTEKVTITNGGSVGIGVTNPVDMLEVAGTVKATGFTGSGAMLSNLPPPDLSPITLSAGKVGVGTDVPDAKLHVDGGSVNTAAFMIAVEDNGSWPMILKNKGAAGDGLEIHHSAPGGIVQFWNSWNTGANAVISLAMNGNVGVGTPDPGSRLQVSGGDVDVSGVYRKAGIPGTSAACGASEALKGAAVSGGIVTGGSCAAVPAQAELDNKVSKGGDVMTGTLTLTEAAFSYPAYSIKEHYGLELRGNDTHPVQILDGSLTVGYNATSASYGTNSLLVAGNVGIGTTQPDGRLHASGGRLVVTGSGGGTDTGQIRIDPVQGTSMPWYLVAQEAGGFYLSEGVDRRFVVAAGGNVGVGTTQPVYGLDVKKIIAQSGTIPNAAVYLGAAGGEQVPLIVDDRRGAGTSMVVSNDGGVAGAFFAVKADGKVGIGTTDPKAKLHVKAAGTAGADFNLDAETQGGVGFARLNFQRAGTTKWALYRAGGDELLIRDEGASPRSVLTFNPQADVVFDPVRNVVFRSGKVGIGTTNPSDALAFYAPNSNQRIAWGNDSHNWSIGPDTADGATADRFSIRDATLNQVRLAVDTAGDVGIGTTSPSERLEVAGAVKAGAFIGDGSRLSGVTATDSTKVAKAGDAMTGPLTLPADGLSVGGGQLVAVGGKVGVGTTSPVAALDVGTGYVHADRIFVGNGGNPLVAWNSGGIAEDGFHIGFDGTEPGKRLDFVESGRGVRMTLGRGGNVGFGTTSPAAKVHVSGGSLRFDRPEGVEWNGSNERILTSDGSGGITAGTILLRAGGADRMAVHPISGNIGIGTAAPAEALHVHKADVTADRYHTWLYGTQGNGWAGFRLDYLGGTPTPRVVRFMAERNTDLRFGTSDAPEALTVANAGNLGLGTGAPSARLDVQSGGRSGAFSENVTGVSNLVGGSAYNFGSDTNMTGTLRGLYNVVYPFAPAGGSPSIAGGVVGIDSRINMLYSNWSVQGDVVGLQTDLYPPASTTGSVLLQRWNSSGVTKAVLDAEGRLGLGTSAPGAALDVAGSGRFSHRINVNLVNDYAESRNLLYLSGGVLQVGDVNTNVTLPRSVGIGTSAPGAKLEVKDAGGGTSVVALMRQDDDSDFGLVVNNGLWSASTTNGLRFRVDLANLVATIEHYESGSAQLALQPNGGNVGIGTTASSERLRISSPAGQLGLEDSSSGETRRWTFNANSNKLFIADSTVGTDRLAIDSAGNVGIGLAAPQSALHLAQGTIRVDGADPTLYLRGSSTDHRGRIILNDYNAEDWHIAAGDAADGAFSIDRDIGAGASDFVISNTGNVGIGTTSPSTGSSFSPTPLLQVYGDRPTLSLAPSAASGFGTVQFKGKTAGSEFHLNFQDGAASYVSLFSYQTAGGASEVFRIQGDGNFSVPKRSAVATADTEAFTMPASGAFVKVPYVGIRYDHQGEYDATNHRFTPEASGIYLVCVSLYTTGTTGGFELDIYHNGGRWGAVVGSLGATASGCRPIKLAPPDYIEVWAHNGTGADRSVPPNGLWNWLTIDKLN